MRQKTSTSYTVDTSYDLQYESLSQLVNTQYLQNANELFVVQLNIKETTTGSFNKEDKTTWNKVVSKEHLNQLLQEPYKYKELEKTNTLQTSFTLVTQEYLDHFVHFGGYGDHIEKLTDTEPFKQDKHVSNNFLKDITKLQYKFVQFAHNSNTSTYIKDTEGKLYLSPYKMDYCNGNLDNEHYDLDLVVEHLSKFSNVTFVLDDALSYSNKGPKILKGPFNEDTKGMERIISDIPHYNATEEQTESIEILYFPNEEDTKRILDWQYDKNDKRDIYSVEVYIIKEILGCQQFCKNAPLVEEDPEIPKRKFKK